MALFANNKGLGSAKSKKKTASTKLQQNINKRNGTVTTQTGSTLKKANPVSTKPIRGTQERTKVTTSTIKDVIDKVTGANGGSVGEKPLKPIVDPVIDEPKFDRDERSDYGSNGDNTNETGSVASASGATQTVTTPTVNYQQLIDYFKEKNEAARKSAIDAITARVNAQRNAYNTQMDGLGDQYQALRNQSEVERYKTRSALREAQANRGQLNSGYGRQEQLLMDTQYGNAINSINMQEQSARNEIKNLIQQMEAEGEADKTEVNNNYASAVQQYIAQLQKDSQQ